MFVFLFLIILYTHLERLFVDVHIIAHVCLLGFAEENEILEEEDMTEALLLPEEHDKLILANQLALLLQIHLVAEGEVEKNTSMFIPENP